MKKQIVVIGLERFGESIARTLIKIGHEVLALDKDEALVQSVEPFVTHAVRTDPTDETALQACGVGNFDVGVVALSEIEDSVLTTIALKNLGVRFIIARAISEPHGKILAKIGADKIVYPELEMGAGVAYVLTLGDIIDYIPLTTGYGVVKMTVPANFVGKSLSEVGFSQRGRLEVIVLILHHKQDILISPAPNEVIKSEDVLIVSGNWDKLEELFSRFQKAVNVK